MELQNAITGYWLEKRSNLSPRTVRDYELVFDRLCAYARPQCPIEEMTSDDIRHFLNRIREKYKLGDKSIINTWIALSSLWTWANTELGVPHIVRPVSRPGWTPPAIEPLTRIEVSALISACDQLARRTSRKGNPVAPSERATALRDRAIILILLDAGVRASELTGLDVRDLDTSTGRVHIRHGKGDKARILFLGDSARRAIWRYLNTRPKAAQTDPLFAVRGGGRMDTDNLRHMLERCAARAGVANVHPHRFRHTFAITFLRNGGNVLELQAMLGHSSMDTVRIYARLAQVDLQQAQKRASPADNWRL